VLPCLTVLRMSWTGRRAEPHGSAASPTTSRTTPRHIAAAATTLAEPARCASTSRAAPRWTAPVKKTANAAPTASETWLHSFAWSHPKRMVQVTTEAKCSPGRSSPGHSGTFLNYRIGQVIKKQRLSGLHLSIQHFGVREKVNFESATVSLLE
jgi:hypothetical protein